MKNYSLGSFPNSRLRRNRKNQIIRDLVAENSIQATDLILPLFLIEGENKIEEISSLEDVYRFSIDEAVKKIDQARKVGIKTFMLFASIDEKLKDEKGSNAFVEDNLICRAIKTLKNIFSDIILISDIALDPFTSHGHDGILDKNNDVDNDKTISALCEQAINQAKAGSDFVAPSDMMDGRIAAIRRELDKNNFTDVGIISYSAKYASNFYSPFRDAVGSNKKLKTDKKTYQMDFRNSEEAMREIAFDISEGADMVIVKPGIIYLDIVAKASENFSVPIISYQVSGEYAMLKIAAKNNILDFNQAMMESVMAMKRAGATAIITYAAIEIAALV
jgi:porphobilinogen synthase